MTSLVRAAFLALAVASGPAFAQAPPAPPGEAPAAAAAFEEALAAILDEAEALAPPLETVIVAREGVVVAERGYRGARVDRPTNIKSASKPIVAALVGAAIARGVLDGVDQPIGPILRDELPDDPDPRMERVTIGRLLSMQAGLGSTSGPEYGRWVAARNWVRAALARPFVAEPGGPMVYSTGSTHLLSAILSKRTGRSTLALAQDWLAPVEGFRIASWSRDPQGVHLGGNEMAMTPRSLLAFGELHRRGGLAEGGERVLPQEWVARALEPRTRSRFTGDGYGYGWFARRIAGADVRYAWGYGGQMLYLVPDLGLTVTMTSRADAPAARTGHRDDLHALLGRIVEAARDRPPAP